MPRISAEQWAGARVISETTSTKDAVLAAAMRTTARTIRRHAAKEGWVKYRPAAPAGPERAELPEAGEDLSLDDVRRRLAEVLPRQLAQIVAMAERGVVDKARIEALVSMGRILERSETLAAERAEEKQKRSDDELAATLERIDDRIIELAEAYAERLGRAEHRGETG